MTVVQRVKLEVVWCPPGVKLEVVWRVGNDCQPVSAASHRPPARRPSLFFLARHYLPHRLRNECGRGVG